MSARRYQSGFPRHRRLQRHPQVPVHQNYSFFESPTQLSIFQLMIEVMGDQVIVIRKDGRIVFVNEAAAISYGFPLHELINKLIMQFNKEKMSFDQWQKEYFEPVKKAGKPISFTIERRVKGGAIRNIDVTAVYMRYESKEYMLCLARDITDRLARIKEVRESEDKYRLLSEQAGEAIFTLNLEGHVVYVNKAGKALLSLPTSRIIGSHFKKNIDKRSLVKAWKDFLRVKQGTPMLQKELNIRDSAHRLIPVEFTASPIYRNGRVIEILIIVRNIARRKEVERLLRDAEKAKALELFIAGTVNEIRNPLKNVLDKAQTIIGKYKHRDFEFIGYREYKEILQSLEAMRDQLQSCCDTTSQLTMLSHKKAGLQKQYCQVNAVIKEAINQLRRHLDASEVSLKLQLADHLPAANIGAVELTQVIVNILMNAIESVTGKGEIHLKTFYKKSEKKIHFVCQDTGAGIARENLPRVFDPFFTTKNKGAEKSPGLGLSIVDSIIKACKGDIFITSSLHKGTIVNTVLPVFRQSKHLAHKQFS
ncbi:MAG: PAS domain S-box protein [Candidatus Omnitrophota bacterium]|nr:PAS domain S-box protein [Candidatus Omnitrophota bacterium]